MSPRPVQTRGPGDGLQPTSTGFSRREARRPPRRAAHEVRAGHQPQDRQGPRPDDPAVAPAAGGSGDRVMDRRTFLGALTGGLLAAPLAAEAQQAGKVYADRRILAHAARRAHDVACEAFRQGLARARLRRRPERRHRVPIGRGQAPSGFPRSRPSWSGSRSMSSWRPERRRAAAAKQATTTIPIVFVDRRRSGRSGLVASLARPGGNVTGLTSFSTGAGRQAAGAAQGGRPQALAGRGPLAIRLTSRRTGRRG